MRPNAFQRRMMRLIAEHEYRVLSDGTATAWRYTDKCGLPVIRERTLAILVSNRWVRRLSAESTRLGLTDTGMNRLNEKV